MCTQPLHRPLILFLTSFSSKKRLLRTREKLLQNPTKNILDGDFIHTFNYLPVSSQEEFAGMIGSDVERIRRDLKEVMSGTDYF